MPRTGTRWLRIVLIVAALVVVAGVLLSVFFPRERVRVRATALLEETLQRPVEIGAIDVRLFPVARVTLREVLLGESGSGPPTRIRFESLDLRVRLLPLLGRRLDIVRIDLIRPAVWTQLAAARGRGADARAVEPSRPLPGKDGRPAFDSAAAGPGKPSAEAPAAAPPGEPAAAPMAAPPLNVRVRELRIRDGHVAIEYPDGRPFLELGGVSETLSANVTTGGQVELRGTTRIDTLRMHLAAGTLGEGLVLRFEKSLAYDLHADRLHVIQAELDLAGLPVAVTGEVTDLAAGAPRAALALAGGPAGIRGILAFLPAGLLPGAEAIDSEGTLAVRGHLRGPLAAPTPPATGPDFGLDLRLTEGRIHHPRIPESIEGIALHLRATPDTIEVAELTGRAGESRVELRATLADYTRDPRLQLALDADLDLALASARQVDPAAPEVAGRLVTRLVVTGPTARPADLEAIGTLTLTGGALRAPALPSPIREIEAHLRVAGTRLTVEEISARSAASDIRLRGRVDDYLALLPALGAAGGPGAAEVRLDLTSDRLDLNEFALPPAVAGAAGGESAPRRAAPRVAAGGDSLAPAVLVAAALGRLRGVIGVRVEALRLQRLEAQQVHGTITLEQGLLRFQGVGLHAFQGEIGLQGEFDGREPQRPTFDLTVEARQVAPGEVFAYVPGLDRFGQLGRYIRGAFDASATMRGGLNDTLGLDMASLTSRGTLEMHAVELSGHPLQNSLASYLHEPGLRTLSVDDWLQPFRIENGRLLIEGLHVRAGELELFGSGWHALDGSLELTLELLLPRAMAEQARDRVPAALLPLLLDETGTRLRVPLTLSGRASAPEITVDATRLQASARQRADERLAAERRRLQEDLRRGAGGLLDDLIDAPADTSADSTATKSEQIEERVRGLLQGLLGKKKSKD